MNGLRTAKRAISRKIAIEDRRAEYEKLVCGHYGEDPSIMPVKPPRGKRWCETHGRWVRKAPRTPEPVLPDDPRLLF
jgi:hypothetical protein